MLCLPDGRDTAGRNQKEKQRKTATATEKLTAQRKYVHVLSMYVIVKKYMSFHPARYLTDMILHGL